MRIVVVSTNAGVDMGGEAIKAYQYFAYLLSRGQDAHLLTHARCRDGLTGAFPAERLIFVEDDVVQKAMWHSRVGARFLPDYFHIAAARLIRRRFDPVGTVLHYLCPISPAIQRFPPRGFRYVVGPLSGNVFYPPAFRARAGRLAGLRARAYRPVQAVLGALRGDMRRADCLLISGAERTRAALRWAGGREARMLDVIDSGVSGDIAARPRLRHAGRNPNFVWMGRMEDYKGADLAIRAVAAAGPDIRLTVYGGGPELPALTALARDLGIADRVAFAGWLEHGRYAEAMAAFRGFVFPTLAEANGIVVQEAMMLGLPVVALDWAGPAALAPDGEAVLVTPEGEAAVVAGLAAAMDRLAGDAAFAETLSIRARRRAEAAFGWDVVAGSWAQAYGTVQSSGVPAISRPGQHVPALEADAVGR